MQEFVYLAFPAALKGRPPNLIDRILRTHNFLLILRRAYGWQESSALNRRGRLPKRLPSLARSRLPRSGAAEWVDMRLFMSTAPKQTVTANAAETEATPTAIIEMESSSIPVSFAQRRLWFLDKLEPDSPLYNLPTVLRITGPLEANTLQRAIDAVVSRHEILRTRSSALRKPLRSSSRKKPPSRLNTSI